MEEEILKCCEKPKAKTKRDIFRVVGGVPTAVNLEHVTMISVDGNRITFSIISGGLNVDLETPEQAIGVFEQLLQVWAGDVVA